MSTWSIFDVIAAVVIANTLSITVLVAVILRIDGWAWRSVRTVMYAVTCVTLIVTLTGFMIYTGDIEKCVSSGGTFMQFQKESMCVMEKSK